MKPLSKNLKAGQNFYVVTPHPDDPKRKYLHSLPPATREFVDVVPRLAPTRALAKKFKDLQMAQAFADFLNRQPDDVQFCVAVE